MFFLQTALFLMSHSASHPTIKTSTTSLTWDIKLTVPFPSYVISHHISLFSLQNISWIHHFLSFPRPRIQFRPSPSLTWTITKNPTEIPASSFSSLPIPHTHLSLHLRPKNPVLTSWQWNIAFHYVPLCIPGSNNLDMQFPDTHLISNTTP